ncbi:hypothetical protein [Lysinibacillus sp. G4S2]|uniref:hypothetical protein n=1 Tax=Lysinibacillus sp. G4S2 TaxID=3055859 RepID=UPI0025A088AF|nr:hypothetical protein [Lysinibacillus sp. G4S2]MDM5245715.1 hypothetical protein [Lysinibacillus sp. G4S2]
MKMKKGYGLRNTNKVLDENVFFSTYYSNDFSFIRLLDKLGGIMFVDAAVLDELLVTNKFRPILTDLFQRGILMLCDPENKYSEISDKVELTDEERSIYRFELRNIRSEFNKIEAAKSKANPNRRKPKNDGEAASLALARVLHLPIICTDDTSVPHVIKQLELQIVTNSDSEEKSEFIRTYGLYDLCEELIIGGVVTKTALKKIYKNAIKGDRNEEHKLGKFNSIPEPVNITDK